MNKRGPKPKKADLANLAGAPAKPDYLDEVASAEWDRIIELLHETGNLSILDGSLLATYCECHADARRHRATINEEGWTIHSKNNGLQVHPLTKQLNQAEAMAVKIANWFGFSPHSRKAIKQQATTRKPKSRFDDIGGLPGK